MKEAVIEPRVGGRWYERGEDGSECQWGKVLVWDPPRRVVLSWQLDANFQYVPEIETEVEIRFTPEGTEATRVDLEHRHLERFGEQGESLRGKVDSKEGWGKLLEIYAAAAAK